MNKDKIYNDMQDEIYLCAGECREEEALQLLYESFTFDFSLNPKLSNLISSIKNNQKLTVFNIVKDALLNYSKTEEQQDVCYKILQELLVKI